MTAISGLFLGSRARQSLISCDRHRQMCRSTLGGFPVSPFVVISSNFIGVLPERAVGVTALPCPAGQEVLCSQNTRRHPVRSRAAGGRSDLMSILEGYCRHHRTNHVVSYSCSGHARVRRSWLHHCPHESCCAHRVSNFHSVVWRLLQFLGSLYKWCLRRGAESISAPLNAKSELWVQRADGKINCSHCYSHFRNNSVEFRLFSRFPQKVLQSSSVASSHFGATVWWEDCSRSSSEREHVSS